MLLRASFTTATCSYTHQEQQSMKRNAAPGEPPAQLCFRQTKEGTVRGLRMSNLLKHASIYADSCGLDFDTK